LDIHAEVTLDGLQGEAHLHIVLDIDVVELEPDSLQQRAFPTLTTGDDVIIDLLDLFRGKAGADGLDDVLVVSFAVETAVDGILIDTRDQSVVVVVDDGEVLGFVVLENYDPVMGEDFTVIGY
jgi:hypothetical protein